MISQMELSNWYQHCNLITKTGLILIHQIFDISSKSGSSLNYLSFDKLKNGWTHGILKTVTVMNVRYGLGWTISGKVRSKGVILSSFSCLSLKPHWSCVEHPLRVLTWVWLQILPHDIDQSFRETHRWRAELWILNIGEESLALSTISCSTDWNHKSFLKTTASVPFPPPLAWEEAFSIEAPVGECLEFYQCLGLVTSWSCTSFLFSQWLRNKE